MLFRSGSKYEHDSFDAFLITRVANIEQFKDALTKNRGYRGCTFWQGVNNITGEVFPIEEIGFICHGYNCFYICDMTAMIGKVPIPANIDQWCDCAVWSGHKLGTELGIGAMWISDRLDEWLNGFKLHGTPNLAGALAMTQAVEDACDIVNIECHNKHWMALYKYFGHGLIDNQVEFETVDAGGCGTHCVAINAVRLPGFNADALQQYLASKQIYVSIGGSACTEKHDYRVLNAYGLSNDEASEVIRVSFGEDSSIEDVKALVDGIKEFKEKFV